MERYVTFRRHYESLDFDITYHNNGGMVPGPSEWDVRLVASVPENELDQWVPSGVKSVAAGESDWLKSVPTTVDTSNVGEWYVDGRRVVGIDRSRRVVVYRLYKF
ncbi:MAG: hypothetical protein QM770_13330 [Tepidisphaeraceae bacterium]